MKLAGAIIIYNPDDDLVDNILTYIDGIEKLYIFNNSPIDNISLPESIKSKMLYVHTGENKGIAERLNEAIQMAKLDKYEYLLTMDQDSSFNPKELFDYKLKIEKYPLKDEVAMYGIAHNVKELNTAKPNNNNNNNNNNNDNNKLITSGSIINLGALNKELEFDENLFIDNVDIDFCFTAWRHNLKTILFNDLLLNHKMGEIRKIITPLFQRHDRIVHTPSRLYYIVRYYLYIRKKHPKFKKHFTLLIISNEIKNGILYGGNPFLYMKFIFKGYTDFLRGKMGKL
jgi:rhamnosyltransferase